MSIVFLGPDGSGKSTVIDRLLAQDLPFNSTKYFHLKPILKPNGHIDEVVKDPHQDKLYSALKSYSKLIYFIFQYNWGWFKNIRPLKKSSCLIIFDRYFDDLLADPKRYRYGGNKKMLQIVRNFIPRPDLYFILTAEAEIIYKRKQEVAFEELTHQIMEYKALTDNKQYIHIDVNKTPETIGKEVLGAITKIRNGSI